MAAIGPRKNALYFFNEYLIIYQSFLLFSFFCFKDVYAASLLIVVFFYSREILDPGIRRDDENGLIWHPGMHVASR